MAKWHFTVAVYVIYVVSRDRFCRLSQNGLFSGLAASDGHCQTSDVIRARVARWYIPTFLSISSLRCSVLISFVVYTYQQMSLAVYRPYILYTVVPHSSRGSFCFVTDSEKTFNMLVTSSV